MKRGLGIIVLIAAAASAFALDAEVSIGGDYGRIYEDYLITVDGTSSITARHSPDFNIEAAVNIHYLMFRTGYLRKCMGTVSISDSTVTSSKDELLIDYIPLELLGRYPVAVGPVSIVPMLGIEYDIALSAVNSSGKSQVDSIITSSIMDFNRLYAKAGFCVDIPVSDRLSIRPEAFFQYGLYSVYDSNYVDLLTSLMTGFGGTVNSIASRTMCWQAGLYISYKL